MCLLPITDDLIGGKLFFFSFVNLDYPCLLKTSSSIKLCVYLILCTCVYLKRYNNLLCV